MKIRTRIFARLLAASGALILTASLLGGGLGGTAFGAQAGSLPTTSTRDLEDVPTWVFVLSLALIISLGLILRGPPRGADTNRI
jgi:hypothetical protein